MSTRIRGLAAVLAVSLFAAGCSSAVGEQRNGADSDGPVSGGTLTLATNQDLVPTNFYSGTNSQAAVAGLVYDSLIDYPVDEVTPEPSLATSWDLSDDGLSLSLELRDDVTFHSGRPFTAADVQFSIESYADPERTAQLQRTAGAVSGFDIVNDHQITLEFAHPLSNIFDLLDMVPIIDEETYEGFVAGEEYVGTGAFTFESWTPGSEIKFAKNADYWDGEPHLDGVNLKVIADPTAQVNQLRSGQVDLIFNASLRDLESLDETPGFASVAMTGAEFQYYIGTNVSNEALSDQRLRHAISYAVDRDRIAEEVFRGRGRAINLPWPQYSPAFNEEKDVTFAQDVDEARSLVNEVGGEVPTLPLAYMAGDANLEAAALIVQEDLAEVGIETELDPQEASEFLGNLIGSKFEGLWMVQHSFAQYTPSTLAVSAYPFNAENNSSQYIDEEYQKLSTAAWQVPDGTSPEAVEAYGALSDKLLDAAFLIELVEAPPYLGITEDAQDIRWSKKAEIDLSDAYLAE